MIFVNAVADLRGGFRGFKPPPLGCQVKKKRKEKKKKKKGENWGEPNYKLVLNHLLK